MHVLLVDDHEMFRQGLRLLLTDLNDDVDFTDAGTCEEALGVLDDVEVDLALLDLNMPGTDGLSALQKIHKAYPAVQIAVLSGMDEPALIRDAIDQGASGFVPKALSSEVLVAALKLILAGGVYLPQAALNTPAEAPAASGRPRLDLLSDRQTDVLLKAIQGKPNKEIAREMSIAEGTVKTHLSAAFRALGYTTGRRP